MKCIDNIILLGVGTGLSACILERTLILKDGQHGKMELELTANDKFRSNNLSLHRSGKNVGYCFKY